MTPHKLGPKSFVKIGPVTAEILLIWTNVTRTYGSSGPGRGKSWTNVTFFLKVRGCYGQRKAKIHTLSSPTILS